MSSIPNNFVISKKFTRDYLKKKPTIKRFIKNPFFDSKKRNFSSSREDLVEILWNYNNNLDASSQVMENIKKVREKDTYFVIGGQQPGLFTGPLITVYKAISTIVLSERYSKDGLSLVPIFWNASEDHDVSEVDHICLFSKNKPETICLDHDFERKSFESIRLEDLNVFEMIDFIEENSPSSEFLDPILKDLRNLVRDSSTISDFFSRLLQYFCRDYGLILVEPFCLREKMTKIFEKLIKEPCICTKILKRTNSELKDEGYSPQVRKKENVCNFFVLDDSGKREKVYYDNEFLVGNKKYSKRDLLEFLEKDPKKFSCNVVTRPIAQDFLLPTYGFVAGPNEIAYLGQLGDIYDFFSVEMPVIFPRHGATILENKIEKILNKYDIKPHSLKNPQKLMKNLASEKTQDEFNDLRKDLEELLDHHFEKIKKLDDSFETKCSITKNKILKEVNSLESDLNSKLKKENKIMQRQIKKGQKNLFPRDELQERVINVFEYLPKFGEDFLDTVYKEFSRSKEGEHVILKCQ